MYYPFAADQVARVECNEAAGWSWQLHDGRLVIHQPLPRARHAHHFTPFRSGSCHPPRYERPVAAPVRQRVENVL